MSRKLVLQLLDFDWLEHVLVPSVNETDPWRWGERITMQQQVCPCICRSRLRQSNICAQVYLHNKLINITHIHKKITAYKHKTLAQRKKKKSMRGDKIVPLAYFRCSRLGEELSWRASLIAALRPWAEPHLWACYRRLQWYDNTATWRWIHMTDSRLHPWKQHRSVQLTARFFWLRIDLPFSVMLFGII